MSDVRRTEGDAPNRLARLAHAMTQALESHVENRGTVTQAIVLLHDDKRATAHFWGYDQDGDAFDDMLQFVEKLGQANGVEVRVVEVHDG